MRGHNQMPLFQDVLDDCEFMDLGLIGPKFTWSKNFDSGHSVWERLDHGLATNSWFLRFLGTWVYHLPCLSLDHCPLLLNPTGIKALTSKKTFRFEWMSLSNSRCGEVVEAAWCSCASRGLNSVIIGKIDKCGKDLTWWNQNVFGNICK